jgi:hypothetical protein
MYQTINQSDFVSAFKQSERKNQFSYTALCAIFDNITEIEGDGGDEYEFDLIAICCGWTEYDSALEAAQGYGFEALDSQWGEDNDIEALELERFNERRALKYLRHDTQVIELKGGAVVIQNF